MLSRTAENLYWLARYVERAEYIARTIEATLRVAALPTAYIGKTNEWDSALLTAGVGASFDELYDEADERNQRAHAHHVPQEGRVDEARHDAHGGTDDQRVRHRRLRARIQALE